MLCTQYSRRYVRNAACVTLTLTQLLSGTCTANAPTPACLLLTKIRAPSGAVTFTTRPDSTRRSAIGGSGSPSLLHQSRVTGIHPVFWAISVPQVPRLITNSPSVSPILVSLLTSSVPAGDAVTRTRRSFQKDSRFVMFNLLAS